MLVLPLDDYSRRTYISENALLPGQVHTYFAGSDQNVFRGYKREVDYLGDEGKTNIEYDYAHFRQDLNTYRVYWTAVLLEAGSMTSSKASSSLLA